MSVFEPKPPADLATELIFLEGSVRARSSIVCIFPGGSKFASRRISLWLPFKEKYRQLLHRIGALCEARGVALLALCNICYISSRLGRSDALTCLHWHPSAAGINLGTALDDSYWSSLEARAGRIHPDHFLRTWRLFQRGELSGSSVGREIRTLRFRPSQQLIRT